VYAGLDLEVVVGPSSEEDVLLSDDDEDDEEEEEEEEDPEGCLRFLCECDCPSWKSAFEVPDCTQDEPKDNAVVKVSSCTRSTWAV